MSQYIEWRDVDGSLKPVLKDERGAEREVAWAPQPGSQEAFLLCPITEVLYEGTRGPGKTDALLMDFAQHVGQGWGKEWRGILFRRTYPELTDVIDKSKTWFPRLFPGSSFNEAKSFWEFPDGEKLFFRQFAKPQDYWSYHGHAYPWIAWEELTTWPDEACYKAMFSCHRSTSPGIPLKYRATTNPYGVGHNWVKNRFRLPVPPGSTVGKIIDDARDEEGEREPTRVAVHGNLDENRILLHAQPDYKQKLRAAARNPAELEAWLRGSWDIVAGGMFDDVWYHARHQCVLPSFEIPSSWRLTRSFDWGSSKPFSVGWWAISDGSDLTLPDGRTISTVRGDMFRVAEWYGWNGRTPNEGLKLLATDVAAGIVERELKWGWRGEGWCRVKPGPADSAIFNEENANNISRDMAQVVRLGKKRYPGVKWHPADKRPGSRKHGWEVMRKLLSNTVPPESGTREHPGMFVCSNCDQWLRTVPSLPRAEKDPDDADTDAEDHIADESRYMAVYSNRDVRSDRRSVGMY